MKMIARLEPKPWIDDYEFLLISRLTDTINGNLLLII